MTARFWVVEAGAEGKVSNASTQEVTLVLNPKDTGAPMQENPALMADFVTPMSLPIPGWTKLYELPSRDLRKFAHDVYSGPNWGDGVNLRSFATSPLLSVTATETIVRTAVHGTAFLDTGSAGLVQGQRAKRTEMLLAGHSIVGAFCLGRTVFSQFVEGPLALRHVDAPVLIRVGCLALQIGADAGRRRRLAPPTWQTLLEQSAQPWQLDSAVKLENWATRHEPQLT